jgi:hypothetical protein
VSLGLNQPLWLLLALLALPLAIIGLRWMVAMARVRRWSAIALRTALLVLLAGALAGAATLRTTDRLAVIAVVDISESARELSFADSPKTYTQAIGEWLDRAKGERETDDLFGVVVFDGRRAALLAPAARDTGEIDLSLSFREGTDIEGAHPALRGGSCSSRTASRLRAMRSRWRAIWRRGRGRPRHPWMSSRSRTRRRARRSSKRSMRRRRRRANRS